MITGLICPDCQHENEEERVYCHSCGTKLDRSGVFKKRMETRESEAEIQKRLRRFMDPRRGRTKRILVKATQLVLGAACCAAAIVLFLPREFPPEKKNDAFAPMIGMDLISATSDQNAVPLVYSQEQINSYVASRLRRKSPAGTTEWFPLQRMIFGFEEGNCTVNLQRKIFDRLSIYITSSYRVRLESRNIIAEPTGAFVGQMPIHPLLLKWGNPLLQSAWTALDRERNSVARLAGIEFHPQSVRLVVH